MISPLQTTHIFLLTSFYIYKIKTIWVPLVIETYCDANPELATSNAMVGETAFARTLGSRVPLQCADGYLPEPNGEVEAVCTARSETEGVWVSNCVCACDEAANSVEETGVNENYAKIVKKACKRMK